MFVLQAAYHKARHVSKVALTSIHDILSEMLKRRSELPHFWFYDALFKPFNTLMGLEMCDDEIQDQVNNLIRGDLSFQIAKIGRF